MPDLRTVHTVTVNGTYQVAVGQDADDYQAAVVGMKKSAIGKAMSQAFSFGDDTSDWNTFQDAPRVVRSAKWVAVGAAIEAFLDQPDDEDDDGGDDV